MNKEIVNLLNNLGVPMHLKGYKYLIMAIEMCKENEDIRMSKELYVNIAQRYKDTPQRVERAIRHAIEVAWSRGNIDLANEIFGNSISVYKGKPTNTQFCKTIAIYLKYNLGGVDYEN